MPELSSQTEPGDATKFVGGAAFGGQVGAKEGEFCTGDSGDVHAGVGLVTDTLGITKNAEVAEVSAKMLVVLEVAQDKLASTAEEKWVLVNTRLFTFLPLSLSLSLCCGPGCSGLGRLRS